MGRKFAYLAAVASLTAFSAFAQTGSGGYFTLHNATSNHTVNNFYTSEDGSNWSASWLEGTSMSPGESIDVEFIADSGSCFQYLTVAWMGANGYEVQDDPITIDICDATNVYLGDNEVSYD